VTSLIYRALERWLAIAGVQAMHLGG
jgi:hypothetical protein